jgi:hypothetical protein
VPPTSRNPPHSPPIQGKVHNNLKTERRICMPEVNQRIKIAVNAIGGDYAPGKIVRGVIYTAEFFALFTCAGKSI